ncbi:MAG: dihydroneopterin aldolase [Alphaproteobacteria bacterium]|nr:dihydroneopterin aldolase [Alphaproteobacteria bacterium]
MTRSMIELKGLELPLDLGTYGENDLVPDAHYLDLTLEIDPALVLIETDAMDRVFDYDPLIARILEIAGEGHYETQEYCISRIASLCARTPAVAAIDIALYKGPVTATGGTLGMRLVIPREKLAEQRGSLAGRRASG